MNRNAGAPDTGNRWISYCPSTEVRTRDWEVLMRQTWCWAYVRSFSNAIETVRMGFPEIVGICVPQLEITA